MRGKTFCEDGATCSDRMPHEAFVSYWHRTEEGTLAKAWGGHLLRKQTKDDVQTSASWVRGPLLPAAVVFGVCRTRKNTDNYMKANEATR